MSQSEQPRYFVEWASIRPDMTTFYNKASSPCKSKGNRLNVVVKKRQDNRKFKRLKDALNYLFITSLNQTVWCNKLKKRFNFKINFITLTLSEKQKHTDQEIKKLLLEPFLKWIIYKGASGYVWKAERQNNGNIHFHITTNQYIYYMDIRNKWNTLQFKHGYLKKRLQCDGDLNPNSTDVKAVVNEKKAVKYMFKYVLKKESGKEPIEGHNYGYSRNFARVSVQFESMAKEFDSIYSYINSLKPKRMQFDYVTVLYHELINLKNCPALLRDSIMEAVKKKDRNSLFLQKRKVVPVVSVCEKVENVNPEQLELNLKVKYL